MASQQTTLVQDNVDNMSDAIAIFGTKRPDGQLPLVLVPSRSICSFWMFIPDGVHVIMQKWGAEVPALDPGLRILGPWYKVAFLVTKQSCAYNAPVKNCPTKDNVMVEVDITLIFRIDSAEKFVYLLGAMKFDELLKAATDESIRGLVRDTTHDKIYELRGSKASTLLGSLNEKFVKFGVTITDATITNVVLPVDLAKTLQTETTYDSKQKEEQKKHQFEAKRLNDQEDLEMKKLRAKNERMLQDELARKDRVIIQKGQSEIEAQRKKQLAIIKAEEDAAVMKYKAETEFINGKIEGEKDANNTIKRAEGDSKAGKIEIDQKAAALEKQAEAEYNASEDRAKAIEIEAEAEAKAATQLKEKREFELNSRRLQVLEKLARSGRIIISGENGDNLISSISQAAIKL